MHTLKLQAGEYEIKPSYGRFLKVFNKYEFSELDRMTLAEIQKLTLFSYWKFMKRRWYGLKPFIFRRYFADNVMMDELSEMTERLPKLLSGEDRNLKNSD